MIMSETTDIEKKSLEAHVELCAERYKLLEIKLETVENSVNTTKNMVADMNQKITDLTAKSYDRIITWGTAIIGSLVAICAWLLIKYIQ